MRIYGILCALCLLTGAAPAPSQDSATFDALKSDFAKLHESLRNTGGVMAEDRPVLRAFLARVEAYGGEHPDEAGPVAMALQLSMWLGDNDRLPELYGRLTKLLPDDAGIALSWLDHRERALSADPDEVFAAYEEVFARFPDNDRVLYGWTDRLKKRARYAEAIEILEARELDPLEQPEAAFTLGDCLFAQHRFDESLAILESVPTAALTNPTVRTGVSRGIQFSREYKDLWEAEQALRKAEAEADDLPRVQLQTTRGPILLELYENEAPNTVANFIALTESGFYDRTRIDRVEPDFRVSGGDPNTKPDASGEAVSGGAGNGDPGYLIPDEHTIEGYRNHFNDTIAMWNDAAPNTGGSRFYLNHRPSQWRNGRNTVFGRVIDGQDVVRSLEEGDEIVAATVVRKRDHAYQPKTLPKPEPASSENADG